MSPTFVGVVTEFTHLNSHGVIRLRIKEKTRLKILASIKIISEEDDLHPSKASTLGGQSNYVLCLGPVGHAQLQPIRARSHEQEPPHPDTESGERWPIYATPGLPESLLFLQQLLSEKGGIPDAILRTRHSTNRSPIIISDAMWRPDPRLKFGYGRVAYLAWIPLLTGGSKFAYAETVVPQHVLEFFYSLRAKKAFICVLEELAISAPQFSPELEHALKNTDVLHLNSPITLRLTRRSSKEAPQRQTWPE